jgi:hypothetical protein
MVMKLVSAAMKSQPVSAAIMLPTVKRGPLY